MCPHGYHHSGSMATPALGTRDVYTVHDPEVMGLHTIQNLVCIVLLLKCYLNQNYHHAPQLINSILCSSNAEIF